MEKLVQQGDVLITKVKAIPEGVKKLNHLTLAQGEKTGHHHTVTQGDAELYDKDGVMYLRVKSESAVITHQEHAPVTVEEGVHQIGIVKEYDHFLEESKAVRD